MCGEEREREIENLLDPVCAIVQGVRTFWTPGQAAKPLRPVGASVKFSA